MTGAKAKSPKRVLVFGATGTAGQGAVRALIAAGHLVTCVVRRDSDLPEGAAQIVADVTGQIDLQGTFDVCVSCLASRTGSAKDAWAIDHDAQLNALKSVQGLGVSQFILLSAICVQKPKLEFQHAKLAFEAELMKSGMTYCIVRPTAFFKSLSGQIARVRSGKPFLVFGDGTLTACKPISDDDLGRYMSECIDNLERHNKVLPIGGPGDAITPIDQAQALFELLDKPMNVRRVPVGFMTTIKRVLGVLGFVSAKAADKAELAKIGHYYATESMLVWDEKTGRYDADATPSTGTETLFDFYAKLIAGHASVPRGDHSVF